MQRRLVLLGFLSVLWLSLSAALAREYHVAPGGDGAAAGTAERPLRTISAAARLAQPGDAVTVHEGVYREWVNPPRGGASDAERTVYQAAVGERAVIKGSEVVAGWRKVERGVWTVALPESFFGGYNPYRDLIRGDWFNDFGRPHHIGAVYLDGEPLWEAASLNDVVQAFVMQHAATQWAPPTPEQIGLIGAHRCMGGIIRDNDVSHSRCTDIGLGKHGDSWDNTSQNSTEGYVKTVERALANGWSENAFAGSLAAFRLAIGLIVPP